MKTQKILELKEKADKAYALINALASDGTQTQLIQLVTRDARQYVSSIMHELSRMLDRKDL